MNKVLLSLAALVIALSTPALAQSSKSHAVRGDTARAAPEPQASGVRLSATLTQSDQQVVKLGLVWRVYDEALDASGMHRLVAESREGSPAIQLPEGNYVVHVAYGLAGATRRVAVLDGHATNERLALNAGALKLTDKLGDAEIAPQRLSISIYVPERGNSEAKLVLANARAGEPVALPEGVYHVVSTLLDTTAGALGENNATNSVVTADLRVPAGKLIEATLRHRAATMTLKLVNAPGGEALANTSFSELTPGGDVIRELIGAFPSLVLAEGEYVAIARHDGKTYQNTFKVLSTKDSDVEILAKTENGGKRETGGE